MAAKAEQIEDLEEADCCGHVLDDKGVVFMELKWKDNGFLSRAEVRKVMKNKREKKHYGHTWLKYCDENNLSNDKFRIQGQAILKRIKEHDWADCGRPRVTIEWEHGEETKPMVKDVSDVKGDGNGFGEAWTLYCNSIEIADDGFRKGHVDKSKKTLSKKKRKRIG